MQTLIPGIASAVLRFAVLAALLFLCSDTACVCAAPPEAALKSFKLADGFEISLVASEPDIRQPVAMQFDDRGRLWVVQYLQYPDPAGLKKVKVDQYMRTRFDRVPEPPPRGPKGADRITICEDTDGDGRMDKFKDFVAGLNMATGIAHGYGGVFVAVAVLAVLSRPQPRRRARRRSAGARVRLRHGRFARLSELAANRPRWLALRRPRKQRLGEGRGDGR